MVTLLTLLLFIPDIAFSQTANFTVVINNVIKPISPYIYGTNQLLVGGENWTAMRFGGNRLTGYNWENNASNAGSDWNQSSDDYLASSFGVSIRLGYPWNCYRSILQFGFSI